MCMFFDKRKTRQYDETTELTEMENRHSVIHWTMFYLSFGLFLQNLYCVCLHIMTYFESGFFVKSEGREYKKKQKQKTRPPVPFLRSLYMMKSLFSFYSILEKMT